MTWSSVPMPPEIHEPAAVLSAPLTLPCGVTLANRLVKAATSELLADSRNRATAAHQTLYAAWARNGPGLLLTGNVQIDRRHLEHAGNVAIQGNKDSNHLASLNPSPARPLPESPPLLLHLPHPPPPPPRGS